MSSAGGGLASIAVISVVHDTYDTRIFYKQIASLRRRFRVTYYSPVAGAPEEDWIVPLHKARSKLGRLWTHLSLLRRLMKARADLYLLHDPELLPLGIVLSMLGRTVIWDMHEDTYNDIKTKNYMPAPVRAVASAVYRLVQSMAYRALSGFILAEDAYGQYFKSGRTCVVHNYPLLDRLQTVGAVAKRPHSMVYIGSISTNRGVRELLEVTARLTVRLPDVKLVLIGPFVDERLERECKGWVVERGLERNVEILGPVRNVEAYPLIAQCQVGLALLLPEPNFAKSLPTKMFEYMALGLPVVVTNFPLWQRIVERHQAGAALDPLAVDQVAEAVHGMLTDEAGYARLSANARTAASHYSWETEQRILLDFLSDRLRRGH